LLDARKDDGVGHADFVRFHILSILLHIDLLLGIIYYAAAFEMIKVSCDSINSHSLRLVSYTLPFVG
jgi:hypothetical protein